MEAGSHSGIARLVQPSLGTSALFLSYVIVVIYDVTIVIRKGEYYSVAKKHKPRPNIKKK
jgi:hypothetical protein